MDRVDYMNSINELLDRAENELSNEQFSILLNRLQEVLDDYE